ncbi:hypothetical protein [Anabaena sp. CS-542/02]|uniref:hypothetical protein n=1 Tax=Anabaena sp. CS-542/02 TaxID=3021719 RepID=UPI00232CDE23|nr:hypothetical protein [Anabaena sp. CS-542/02]MDB9446904.1 hypothetical protein [Anabaena sp. CS-542/02]
MLTIKRKSLTWAMLLVVGMGYFSAVSILDINYFGKTLIAMMPIQVVAVIYVTYIRKSGTKIQH